MEEIDYYAALDLKREATDSQIKQAYRKFALKSHPLKNPNNDAALAQFRIVAEAYDVLADPEKRALFDQYGERGLKQGVSNGKGGRAGGGVGYSFQANPEELFADHFGTASPFADFFATTAAQPLFNNLAASAADSKRKVAAQEINLYVSLEELYGGASKSQKILRRRLGMDGVTLGLEEKILKIDIGAGWKEGTKLTFTKEGDEEHSNGAGAQAETGDIVFILRTKPHPRFTRRGNDLVFLANITLLQALTGTTLDVETLDRRVIPVALNELCVPGGNKIVAGEGLPNPKTGVKGNLIIEFNITFPQQLTYEQKNGIKKILAPNV